MASGIQTGSISWRSCPPWRRATGVGLHQPRDDRDDDADNGYLPDTCCHPLGSNDRVAFRFGDGEDSRFGWNTIRKLAERISGVIGPPAAFAGMLDTDAKRSVIAIEDEARCLGAPEGAILLARTALRESVRIEGTR
jgi:hypothetical protein